jgi:hypothetical protein
MGLNGLDGGLRGVKLVWNGGECVELGISWLKMRENEVTGSKMVQK